MIIIEEKIKKEVNNIINNNIKILEQKLHKENLNIEDYRKVKIARMLAYNINYKEALNLFMIKTILNNVFPDLNLDYQNLKKIIEIDDYIWELNSNFEYLNY